jgi:hypothetical protein
MRSAPFVWTAEMTRYAAQDQRDDELEAQRATGVEWDDACREYCAWLDGHQVAWDRTYSGAERKLGENIDGARKGGR